MSAPPRISDAEWLVMEAVWDGAPVAASEVLEALGPAQGWSEATVKTLLARLVKKGAARYERDGKRYLYSPAVRREDCVRSEARSFADRLFGGRRSPMLAWFVRETPLTDDEIAELQALLDEKRPRHGGGRS